MNVEMVNAEKVLLTEAADRRVSRDSMAYTYAFGLTGSEKIDWPKVNTAIVSHRSKASLQYIKERAWRLVRERQQQQNKEDR